MNTVKESEAVRKRLSRFICENRPNVAYSTEDWVKMAKEVAPQFDYSKVEYKDKETKVCIICPKHGKFTVTPKYFLWTNSECPKCQAEKRKQQQQKNFIDKAKKVHDDVYDYSKVEYKTSSDKVCIICPKHGEFWQTMGNHLQGVKCPKCATEESSDKRRKTNEKFLEEIIAVNGDKYDYTNVKYKNIYTPVEFICHKLDENNKEHGIFTITPHALKAKGNVIDCPKCRFERDDFGRRHTKDEFVEQANKVHSGRYDYSKFVYKNCMTKSIIICPEHGEFLQKPNGHLSGQGCPYCRNSHLENVVLAALVECGVKFEYQKRFNWLGLQSLDFYLPEHNVAIECQGQQHYKEVFYRSKKWTKEMAKNNYLVITERDIRKRELCKENGIELIYFLESKFLKYEKSANKCFTDVNKLVEYIKSLK